MSKFTRKCSVVNTGGVHSPFHERSLSGHWWSILWEDADGEIAVEQVFLPLDTCPRKWLEAQGIVLEQGALAERIR